ncbi:MAG: class I mannose-6-phosphate isomerase [Phycisphaeraceae bacterium]|nr:class I mannose-6-phosphate isomerase [Phycisphaeraceae bacterium]
MAYPLVFEPILKEKVWGGIRLAGLGKSVRPGAMVGESWEVADLETTSIGGGGGEAARSVIANGSMRGRTLHEAMEAWGAGLLGGARPSAEGGFPLLVKFLDAREHLSVQVHPSEAYARAHAGAHLKTEAWVVMEAEAGGKIYKGLKEGVTRERFERAVRAGSVGDKVSARREEPARGGERVPALLASEPAIPGACHLLPSGTIHALGAGVLVLEVQTPSDTTFRVYDWVREYGRARRELHIDEAMACIEFGSEPPRASVGRADGDLLCATPFFTMRWRMGGGASAAGACRIAACVEGEIEFEGGGEVVRLARGGVCVIPAACGVRIGGDGTWVETVVGG